MPLLPPPIPPHSHNPANLLSMGTHAYTHTHILPTKCLLSTVAFHRTCTVALPPATFAEHYQPVVLQGFESSCGKLSLLRLEQAPRKMTRQPGPYQTATCTPPVYFTDASIPPTGATPFPRNCVREQPVLVSSRVDTAIYADVYVPKSMTSSLFRTGLQAPEVAAEGHSFSHPPKTARCLAWVPRVPPPSQQQQQQRMQRVPTSQTTVSD